jgi:hypothetical protein
MKKKRRSWKEKEFINQSKYNPEDESEEKNGRERTFRCSLLLK